MTVEGRPLEERVCRDEGENFLEVEAIAEPGER